MLGDFTEKWTTAAAGQIEKLMAAALSAEREACATIIEREAEAGGSTAQMAAKIRQRKLGDNEFLRSCE
jgi:predicted mannosyl-3-phosphoglycerate phosphatase (HAD superfamily)